MPINYNIGDILTVDQTFLNSLSDGDTMLRATKELLGSMSNNQLTLADYGTVNLSDHYVHIVPDAANAYYRNGKGCTVFFRTMDQTNNSFNLQTSSGVSQMLLTCLNPGNETIPKGTVVAITQPGTIPEVTIADITLCPAALGICAASIGAGATGDVVIQGPCQNIDTRGSKTGDSVYLGYTPGSASMIAPGNNASLLGIVSKVARDGIISVRVQPGGSPPNFEVRTIDGTANNLSDTNMGAANTQLQRLVSTDYSDAIAAPAGPRRPSARKISNTLAYQAISQPNTLSRSDFVWVWGQYVDHDIGLTEGHSPAEPFNIQVPLDDGFFTPGSLIPLSRSIYDTSTGKTQESPRQQTTSITSYLDASNIYGSDATRAAALRLSDGSGKLKNSTGDLLPFNTGGLPNAPTAGDPTLFLSGDIRANEQPLLICMHTLFMREHNRLCDVLVGLYPSLNEEQLYQAAKRKLTAIVQAITYNEFLPALLGPSAVPTYKGYDPSVNARIVNVFSTAAFRLGHSMLSSMLLRLDSAGDEIPEGHLRLRDGYFDPSHITTLGIESLLRGAATQVCQNIDPFTIDEIRNFLFGAPNMGGFDLAALNIQRGRDHGLPSYNQTRRDLGLDAKTSFEDVSSDSNISTKLAACYSRVDTIDCWIGGLAEDHLPGSMLGELFHTICRIQFEAFRDGDRFWYQNIFAGSELQEIENTTLADVIRRNTTITTDIPDDVFTVL
jgi:hypothetical protein